MCEERRVTIIGPRDRDRTRDPDAIVVNCTSRSNDFGKAFSPFTLGPVHLYGGHIAQNVENAWQFCKVYRQHTKPGPEPTTLEPYSTAPTEEYFRWAKKGWGSKQAFRYPMGKGAIPTYSYWDGERLDYISARERIYLPLYRQAVINQRDAFEHLKAMYESGHHVILWDFDGYNHGSARMSLWDVLQSSMRPMGHAFVLAMMLTYGPRFTLEELEQGAASEFRVNTNNPQQVLF